MNQNSQLTLGGEISIPKTIWLFAAIYTYFVCSIAIYFLTDPSQLRKVLAFFICIMSVRAFLQSFLMFQSKVWIPTYGMIFNILSALILIIGLANSKSILTPPEQNQLILFFFYLTIIMMLLDSYYAFCFYKLVGDNNTKGENAIWFANSFEKKFNRINKLTFFFNFIILFLISLLVCKILLV